MKPRSEPSGSPAERADKLSGVRRLSIDEEDERPRREDRDYGQTIFTRGTVPLPRFLKPKARPAKR